MNQQAASDLLTQQQQQRRQGGKARSRSFGPLTVGGDSHQRIPTNMPNSEFALQQVQERHFVSHLLEVQTTEGNATWIVYDAPTLVTYPSSRTDG